jgi:hypothetical protein
MAKLLIAKTTTGKTFTCHRVAEDYGATPEAIATRGRQLYSEWISQLPQTIRDHHDYGEFDRCVIVDDSVFEGREAQPVGPRAHEGIDIVNGQLVFTS